MASTVAIQFRRRFRVPFVIFEFLRDRFAKTLHIGTHDACGEVAISVDLKVLASLRILARGNDADTINELVGVSHSTILKNYHAFNRSDFVVLFLSISRMVLILTKSHCFFFSRVFHTQVGCNGSLLRVRLPSGDKGGDRQSDGPVFRSRHERCFREHGRSPCVLGELPSR